MNPDELEESLADSMRNRPFPPEMDGLASRAIRIVSENESAAARQTQNLHVINRRLWIVNLAAAAMILIVLGVSLSQMGSTASEVIASSAFVEEAGDAADEAQSDEDALTLICGSILLGTIMLTAVNRVMAPGPALWEAPRLT